MCARRAGESAEIVAALEQRHDAPAAASTGDRDQFPRQPFEIGLGEREPAERIGAVRVKSCRDDKKVGPETVERRQQRIAPGAPESLAAFARRQRSVRDVVESAAVALTAARERVSLFGTALEAADNAALLARSQYQSGLIDFQTLLSAESQLLCARNALAASEAERANAFIVLNQALGGGTNINLGPDGGMTE